MKGAIDGGDGDSQGPGHVLDACRLLPFVHATCILAQQGNFAIKLCCCFVHVTDKAAAKVAFASAIRASYPSLADDEMKIAIRFPTASA
jgi:hypothetical protein